MLIVITLIRSLSLLYSIPLYTHTVTYYFQIEGHLGDKTKFGGRI